MSEIPLYSGGDPYPHPAPSTTSLRKPMFFHLRILVYWVIYDSG